MRVVYTYLKCCELVIGDTRADETMSAGDDSRDVVLEWPLEGVMADKAESEWESSESL